MRSRVRTGRVGCSGPRLVQLGERDGSGVLLVRQSHFARASSSLAMRTTARRNTGVNAATVTAAGRVDSRLQTWMTKGEAACRGSAQVVGWR